MNLCCQTQAGVSSDDLLAVFSGIVPAEARWQVVVALEGGPTSGSRAAIEGKVGWRLEGSVGDHISMVGHGVYIASPRPPRGPRRRIAGWVMPGFDLAEILPWETLIRGGDVAIEAIGNGPYQAITKLTRFPVRGNSLSLLAGRRPVFGENSAFVDDLERLEKGQRLLERLPVRCPSNDLNPDRCDNRLWAGGAGGGLGGESHDVALVRLLGDGPEPGGVGLLAQALVVAVDDLRGGAQDGFGKVRANRRKHWGEKVTLWLLSERRNERAGKSQEGKANRTKP